jgi:cytosine/adenosine deaminase-related metal-dependent hydrolase
VGQNYGGPVDEEHDYGQSLIMPGLIDLDALADIDHLILDSWPSPDVTAGHLWSEEYFANRRRDVFTRAERHQGPRVRPGPARPAWHYDLHADRFGDPQFLG